MNVVMLITLQSLHFFVNQFLAYDGNFWYWVTNHCNMTQNRFQNIGILSEFTCADGKRLVNLDLSTEQLTGTCDLFRTDNNPDNRRQILQCVS